MKMFDAKLVGSALTIIGLITISAQAASTTYNVSFSANNFQIGSGVNPPPVDPVTGNFTITLDPTVAVFNSTTGITLNSLNIALGSQLAYSYDPAAGGFPAGTLRVGGLNAGTDVITFNPSSNDFWLFIHDFATTPTFSQVGYTQTAVSSNNLFFTLNQTGSVSATVVPEPAVLTLFALSFACLAAGRRSARR